MTTPASPLVNADNAQSVPAVPVNATPPPAPPAPNVDVSGNAPSMPISQPTPPPPAQGTPSVWKNLVMGAIAGLAGSAGSTHFGSGLAGGAKGVLQQKQQQIENQQAQQQLNQSQQRLNFESVAAADTHIHALQEARNLDNLDAEQKVGIKQKSAEYQAFLQDNFGIEPNLIFNDSHDDAVAALTTGAQMNGGTIPPVVTVQSPSPDGEHGQIAAYSPTQQQLQQNSTGWRSLVNQGRAIQGLPDIDNASWNSLGFKGQRDAAQAAIFSLKPTPDFSLDQSKPNYLPVVLAQKQQQLQQYENHKDINGKPDADPATVKQLQAGIDYLKNAWDKAGSMESDQAKQKAVATEQGKSAAELQTPQGQAALAKTQAESDKANFELGQEKREASDLTAPDPTGFVTPLSQKIYDKRHDDFTKSKQFQTLQTLQGSYQQFQDTLNHISQTGDMTGAESVVGLFNAIGISATPLAGKGFRINSNTVKEHENARGLGQASYQKLLSLKNGDVITPQQLKDYSSIASDVYMHTYINAADEAHRQGLPVDFLPKGGGQKPDQLTANIFAQVVAHTHPELARDPAKLKAATIQAAQASGWVQ